MSFSTSQYTVTNECSEVLAANANLTNIEETSGFYLDNTDPVWNAQTGAVVAYRQDELPNKIIEVSPTPNLEGFQVMVDMGQGGFGVIASTTGPNDFDILGTPVGGGPAVGGFGVISSFGGNPFVEVKNPGYGILESMTPSLGNLQLLGTALPFNITNLNASTIVELVPDSAWLYLKYGILSRIFSSESELKDEQRAAYCAARYAEGVNLFGEIMNNSYTEN